MAKTSIKTNQAARTTGVRGTLMASASATVLAFGLSCYALAASPAEPTIQTNSVLGTYLAAHVAEGLRDTSAANSLLKLALERDPSNAALLDQAFVSQVMGGDWTKAVGYATRAVAADPANQLAHLVLGVDAFKAGRLSDAEKHFSVQGSAPVAVIARAWVLNARKDVKGANGLLNSINDPNWVGAFRKTQAALMADVNGDTATAEKLDAQLFAANPSAVGIALDYARHASHMGDAKLAAEILGKHLAVAALHHPMVEAAVGQLARNETLPLNVSNSAEGLADTFYGFSQALESQGALDLALIYTQLALQLRPTDELVMYSQAGILEQLKKYDEAIAGYARLPASSPLHFDAALRAGLNLNALDKIDEAKAALQALIDRKPSLATSTQSRAALHTEVEDLAGVSLYEKGEKIVTLQALLARAGLGDGGGDGKFGSATRDAVVKLQTDAGLPPTGIYTAATRKALEERIAALPTQADAPIAKDRLVDLYTTLGRMLSGRKQFTEASDNFTKAIALIDKPQAGNWDQFYSRAVCFERLNQWDKAEADFLKALELNPNEPLILNYLGYSWVDRNQHVEKALEFIKKAVSLKPEDGFYVDSLGWAYFRMGRFDEAVRQLEHAVELPQGSGDPTINDHLGDAYWRMGRKLEAQYQWSTALTYKPEQAEIPKIQEKLKNGLPAEPPASTTASTGTGVTPAAPSAPDLAKPATGTETDPAKQP